MSLKTKYTHLSQRNQILKRPGQHIGSTKNVEATVWACIDSKIEQVKLNYNHGLIHIFYEVLGNAQDNYFRSKDSDTPLKKIEISIDEETGETTIWNDGLWIPTRLHEWGNDEEILDEKEHYEAEIIFGHLNSSSNYDDTDTKREGGGLHGVGVKLTNIFSTKFTVEAVDPEVGLKFVGVWTDNMLTFNKPKITKKSGKGYTKITFTPDFAKFGMQNYSTEHLSVMKKLCIDSAMIIGQKVVFNGEQLSIKDFSKYVSFYTDKKQIEFKSEDSTVILCEKQEYDDGLLQLSFVNGINTRKGGIHVDEWKKAIFKPLLDKLKSKYSGKTFKINIKNLERYFMLFVNCNLLNPEFNGQTKESLSSPSPTINIPVGKINALMKMDFITDIDETIEFQSLKDCKKTDGKKSTSVSIDKAIDANDAGSAKSIQCTLFITEGLSAKAFAVGGISAIDNGTDLYGVLPIKGKLLNVRNASLEKINENKEIQQIKKMLGLKQGVDYSDDNEFKKLRYGKVKILTDADPDGDHIKGLLINYFHYFFPTLIERNYICSLRTPIIKATIGNTIKTFYYKKDYINWYKKQTNKNIIIKYYKGLGTNDDEDILRIFEDQCNVKYNNDEKADDTINMVFDKKRADDRKVWLENFTDTEFEYEKEDDEEIVNISDFFNNEMIKFSLYDNNRSIPCVITGYKPCQKKAIWVALKVLGSNPNKTIKVAQFAASVAEKADYQHGEISMEQTIIGMAQTFVGANNISLFYESGQYGSRMEGGKDSASSRYIYTCLTTITRFIYRKEDDPILEYIVDEGKQLEPKFFVPVIPMILVNGCKGIGTGYSTHIPSFNPLDLVNWIKVWLKNGDDYPTLIPWYMGFKGTTVVDVQNPNKYTHHGIVNQIEDDYYEITELPVREWTDSYQLILNSLKTGISVNKNAKTGYDSMTVSQLKAELKSRELKSGGKKSECVDRLKLHDKQTGTVMKKTCTNGQIVSKTKWYGNTYDIFFKVWTKPGVDVLSNNTFKLTSTESLTNMTAFTPTGGIKQYETLEDILTTFCNVRLEYYKKRKKYLIQILENKLKELSSKSTFIIKVLDDYTILKQTEDKLDDYFATNDYYKKIKSIEDEEDTGSFSYLKNMSIRLFTTDNYEKLLKEIEKIELEIEYIKTKSAKQMWIIELDEFVVEYNKWKLSIEDMHSKLSKKKQKPKNKGHKGRAVHSDFIARPKG